MQFNTLRYQNPKTKTYLGSPSLVRLPDGGLLATHDYFGPGCPLNHEGEEHLTSVYRSSDHGKTWTNVTHIANAFWSSLFVMDRVVYLLGTSQQSGSIVIRRSTDNGYTWTHPFDEDALSTGLLFKGGGRKAPPNYHCAPVPVLVKDGRLYRAFEDNTPYHWPQGFQACVISADIDADLLDAANWTMSNKLPFDPTWLPESWGPWTSPGWLEGNVVEGPQGNLWNILRLNAKRPNDDTMWTLWNKAAMVKIEDGGRHISFDPAVGFIDLPGGHSKFTIRRDAKSGLYFTISNGVMDPDRPTLRSVLSLYKSSDLRNWEHCTILLEDDSGLPCNEAARLVGFQYVDWQFDGDDIIYLVRTAYEGAHNFHDANRITFHRLENFSRWTQGG
jgi:hypothetical protein